MIVVIGRGGKRRSVGRSPPRSRKSSTRADLDRCGWDPDHAAPGRLLRLTRSSSHFSLFIRFVGLPVSVLPRYCKRCFPHNEVAATRDGRDDSVIGVPTAAESLRRRCAGLLTPPSSRRRGARLLTSPCPSHPAPHAGRPFRAPGSLSHVYIGPRHNQSRRMQ